MELLRVVDERSCPLAVLIGKVIGCDLEGLSDTFTNGYAGNDDDELIPAIALIQFEHRFDVAVGLSCACLHLDIQVDRADLGGFEMCGLRKVLPMLHCLDVLQQLRGGNG